MSPKLRTSALLGLWLLPLAGIAYDPKSHGEMSQVVADRSVVASDPGALQDLGLDPYANGQQFRNSRGALNTIRELISNGAQFEDSDSRPVAHFYNPVTGLGILGFPASPDWAVDGTGDADTIKFSFNAARQYLLNALTDPVQSFRSDRFGLTFQSVGQVIHHLQDMAQPQHVRSDLHCDLIACRFVPRLFNPSAYEYYTRDRDLRTALPALPSYPTVYGTADTSTFASPRRFWNTEPPGSNSPVVGKGIAEFTNRNFVSAGSNFDKPAQPSPPGFSLPAFDPFNNQFLTVSQLCPSAAQCPDSMTSKPDQLVAFYGTAGHDNYLGTDFVNPRASTESVFDQYLVAQGQARIFSLNRFNFDAAHAFLLPRAVGYSTGLLNYFFRGKIDYVPDPDNPGGFLVKNLGTEPMKGKFQVYYDDKTGTRHLVDGMLWDTEVILANDPDTPAVLAPGKGMPVPRITQPTLPEPKTIGEFMLVFTGEMGQERPENGSVGAVVGKVIQGIPYHGELYVAGLDAQNRVVTFKVDPAGLRVLNGFDANGQFHSTPASWTSSQTQTDIDPLLPVVNAFNASVLTKVPRMKQSAFQTGVLGGMSHQLNAVSFQLSGGSFRAYVRDPATGKLNFKDTTTHWTANHPDPAIGWFDFRPDSQSGLGYTRTYRPAPDQNLLTVSGSVPIAASSDQVSLVFGSFNQGEAIASPDGLTVSGIKGQGGTDTSNYTWDTYELRITLGATPTASVVRTESVPQTVNIISPNNRNERIQTGPGSAPYDQLSTSSFTLIDDGERTDTDRRVFEDYIAGNLVTWQAQTFGTQVHEVFRNSSDHLVWSPPPTLCNPLGTASSFTFTEDFQSSTQATWRNIYTTTVQLDQSVVSVIKSIPRVLADVGNFTSTRTSHEHDVYVCPPGVSSAPPPEIHEETVYAPDALDQDEVTGVLMYRSLTGTFAGSIIFDRAKLGFVLNGTFLGQPNTNFIADSSPLGEIFLAMTDKSTIIYQPLPSSKMPPTIDIPANIIKLIAAIWL